MNHEELNAKVYKETFSTQERFRKWRLAKSPKEILNHAYDYTLREDLLPSLAG